MYGDERLEAAIPLASAALIAIPAIAPVPAITTATGASTASATPIIPAAAAAIIPAATIVAATAAGRSSATATATAGSGTAIFRLAHPKTSPAEIRSVELGDGGLSHLATGEGDKGKPALATGLPVEWHM